MGIKEADFGKEDGLEKPVSVSSKSISQAEGAGLQLSPEDERGGAQW